ncbi:MAG: hypothetical protein ACOVMN_01645, partial [Flexibacteraceae bacterium]
MLYRICKVPEIAFYYLNAILINMKPIANLHLELNQQNASVRFKVINLIAMVAALSFWVGVQFIPDFNQ